MTAVKRKKVVNVRRKKFVKNLVDGLGVGQAALRAGYATRTEGSALLREPSVLTALQEAMSKAGIDDEYLSSKIKEGLEATYPEKRTKDGSILQDAAPDFFTRGQYLDKALKVRGDYAPERHIDQKQILTINVNMDTIRGLKDCGVIDVEEITDDRRESPQALPEAGHAGGGLQEGQGECRGAGEAGQDADQADDQGGVPEEAQRREGPGEKAAPYASPQGADV